MIRRVLQGFAAAAALGLLTFGTPVSAASYREDLEAAYQKAQSAARSGSCGFEGLDFINLIDKPDFTTLDSATKYRFYSAGARCAAELSALERALGYARQATAFKQATRDDWFMRLQLEFLLRKYADAVTTLEGMQAAAPEAVNSLEPSFLIQLAGNLARSQEEAARDRLLALVTGPGYRPVFWTSAGDYLLWQQARGLARKDDMKGARAAVGRVINPQIIEQISLDPLLRKLVPDDLDLRDAAQRFLATRQQQAIEHPDLLVVRIDIVGTLFTLGRIDEGMADLLALKPRVEGQSGAPFADIAAQRNWYWNLLGNGYIFQGRSDDAIAAMRIGMGIAEGAGPNVSQSINLAGILRRLGRFDQALAILDGMDKAGAGMSNYGWMQYHTVRACSALGAGKPAIAQESFEYLKANLDDDPDSLGDYYLCKGDVEGTAQATIKRLSNPDAVTQALLDLADFRADPPKTPENPDKATWDRMEKRADVQAAIAKAGGTRKFDVIDFRY